MTLKSELGLRKPFTSTAHEALLNVYFTASQLKRRADEFFKQFDLTEVQFNVLVLLRHNANQQGGLTQVELSRMMLVNRANITALVDRMEKNGLVKRATVQGDRRYNLVRLTRAGAERLDAAEKPYLDEVERLMSPLTASEQGRLMRALEKVRSNIAE